MTQLPAINAYGIFVGLLPFTLPNANLRCAQLELLTQYIKDDIDAFSLYYAPIGLTNNDYQTDLTNNVSIVRLVDDNEVSYYIPSSYLASIPQSISVPYYRMAISVDIAELSDKTNLTTLLTNIKDLTQGYIGFEPIVKLHKISNEIYYSQFDADIKEAQRQLVIDKTPSYYKTLAALQAENTLLKENIRNLEAAVIALTP